MTQSRISTPVIPHSDRMFNHENELLYFHGQESENKDSYKIISFSRKIGNIDTLAFLQQFHHQNELHFYWENPTKQESIVACGVAKSIVTESSDRFVQAKKFIRQCLHKTIRKGDVNVSGSGPHFFCSFTFFPDRDVNCYSPFPAGTIFIPRFQVVKRNSQSLLTVNLLIDEGENIKLLIDKLNKQIEQLDLSKSNSIAIELENNFHGQTISQTEHSHNFKLTVDSALKSINRNEFSKIVIAHATDVFSQKPFRLIESLYNLRQRHPDCYIFSTSNGKGHNFIGASPERLISIQNQQLVTDALAGSAPRGRNSSEDLYLANLLLKSRKEKREHQTVSDFIVKRLLQLGLTPRKLPLQLRQLSNIQHLWTPIYAHLPQNIDPLEVLAQLHPTPAVAGTPAKIACQQIKFYEPFDRSLYAAPLGWIDDRGNCEFVVGIRSALIEGNRARLYAGAGIVSGSDPDKEFAEVELKLQSLLNALV